MTTGRFIMLLLSWEPVKKINDKRKGRELGLTFAQHIVVVLLCSNGTSDDSIDADWAKQSED